MTITDLPTARELKKFWKGASQEDAYEYLVDGPDALQEIRQFHEMEEDRLMNLLQKHVAKREKIVFIEIGCGPGRVIRKVAQRVFENPETWGKCIALIIGIDFELSMIKKAISSLIVRRRQIRNWVTEGAAYHLSKVLNQPTRKIKETLRNRLVFINADADANFPPIHTSGFTPVLALMFGTLGNMPNFDKVLANISKLIEPSGEAIIVVFDKYKKEKGQERYDILAKQFFPLWLAHIGIIGTKHLNPMEDFIQDGS